MVEWWESNGYGGNKQINGSEGGGEGRQFNGSERKRQSNGRTGMLIHGSNGGREKLNKWQWCMVVRQINVSNGREGIEMNTKRQEVG